MLGYIYKVTNKVNGHFYIGHRHYSQDKYLVGSEYLGSSYSIQSEIELYGLENFTKEILLECDSEEELLTKESEYIKNNIDNPLILNSIGGIKWGGANYIIGTCSKCNEPNKKLYKDNICMSCILGDTNYSYCEKCGKETYHYQSGECKSCASRDSHSIKWCKICQCNTVHMGNNCKSHYIKLHKTPEGKVQVITSTKSKHNAVMFDDVSFIFNTKKEETPKTVMYRIPNNTLKIWSGNKTTELTTVLYNKDVTNWLRIGYKYDSRYDHIKYITLTSDHPLIEYETGNEIQAGNLVIGSKLKRVYENVFHQWNYAEVISIEKLDKCSKSYDVSTGDEHFNINDDIYSHNCRSQLSVLYPKDKPECILEYGTKENKHEGKVLTVDKKWRDPNKAVFYGRLNLGVVTLNLPDIALTALDELGIDRSEIGTKNFWLDDEVKSKFNALFSDRLELCHRALRARYERLRGTPSNVAPILWQDGDLARLEPGETIDKLLINGWATISLGYVGIYETVKALTGDSHTSEVGKELAMYLMNTMHDICNVWKESEPEHLGYSLYGTPEEYLTDKFAKALQRRHGIIKGVTDKLYVTNSYHVPVFEQIDAFSKLTKEAPFQDISSGGNISYVELPSMNKNPDALMKVIRHIYNTNIYAEINTKLDHCMKCGFNGEIELLSTDQGKFKLRCPRCGNEDARKMYVVRRICGYLGRIDSKDNPINPNPSSSEGRLGDIHDRVCHL